MKLSFSTRGWESCSWDEWIDTASDMRFGGVEVYNAHLYAPLFDKGGDRKSTRLNSSHANESRMPSSA